MIARSSARRSAARMSRSRRSASSRNAWTATTNQSEASTALNSGGPPESGKRLGSIPSRHGLRPAQQDLARRVEPAGGQADARQRDERVASPVGKPWIAGDDGRARPARDEIRVGRTIERRGECSPSRAFRFSHAFKVRGGGGPRRLRWSGRAVPRRPPDRSGTLRGSARSSTASSPRSCSAA